MSDSSMKPILMTAKRKTRESVAPLHIAIIPDGNRRWAHANRLNLQMGYNVGIDKVIDVCIWAKNFGVKTVSIWALSKENISERTKGEIGLLYRLYGKAAHSKRILKLLQDNKANVKIIGNMSLLPSKLKDALRAVERQTQMYKDLSINLLVGYGGRDDIAQAVRSLSSENVKRIDTDTIKSRLMTADVPDVDLIIRTSGERRTSGFLPWQSSYSELYFAKKSWPDFGRDDLKRAIENFNKRQRRFGK